MDDRALEEALRAEPPFDPDAGTVVARPGGTGAGCWAGAPAAAVVGDEVVLAYRMRAPAPERGYLAVIARSRDGVHFAPAAMIAKRDLRSLSIERCALVPGRGGWRLFISFVAADDRQWRIEAVDGLEPHFLMPTDVSRRRVVVTAEDVDAAAVKDPWVRRVGDTWYLFTSFAPLPDEAGADLHSTGDALSTGRTGSFTGLAASRDGERWTWRGAVLSPDPERWDGYTTRLSTAIRVRDGWVGFYDGSTLEGNYEERCGVAFSDDLVRWRKGRANGPIVGTTSGPGGVRYVDVIEMRDGTLRAYYEYTRPDGSHELRTSPVRLPF